MAEQAWDLVVLGGGAAGNGGARLAGKLGFKTALVERDRLGGTCTWVGCVPSKALLQAAATHWRLLHGPGFGIALPNASPDPSGALEWVREITNRIGSGPKEQHLAKQGVELLRDTAVFEDEHTVRVGGQLLAAKRILISTGSRPARPHIEGLDQTRCLTNLTLFDLPRPPRSMIIIGAGPVGMEMSQAFNRLGTQVTVLEATGRVLPRDDAELAAQLREHLEAEGVRFELNTQVRRVEPTPGGGRTCNALVRGAERYFEAEELLLATGREPEVAELRLERAGVICHDDGIRVNEQLQTSNPRIYAAGDVIGRWLFTHMATLEGKRAARNALLDEHEPMDYEAAGWCTFTDPELASVGINEAQAQERGIEHEVYRIKPELLDRARIEGRPAGMAKIIAEPNGGRIFGAQVLAARAGELIQEFVAAIAHGIPFRALAEDVHPYPTLSLAHYVPGQMDWLKAKHAPGWLARVRRESGIAGHSDD